ncbi:MAG TPA: hypothetical protein VF438_02290 [Candidatus Paceibacterota bacterium]
MISKQPTQVRGSCFPFEAMTSEAQSRVSAQVMQRITARRMAHVRTAATLYGLTTLLGMVLLVPAISYTVSLAQESGFMSYISLLVSDGADLLSWWRPFVLSVLESAPIVGTVLVLAAILVCGYSIPRLIADINRIKSHNRHAIL